jgi:hypothetical protein
MIAAAGAVRLARGERLAWEADAVSRLPRGGLLPGQAAAAMPG